MKKITVAFLMALVICIFCIPTKTYASSGIMISDELDDLEGDGKYVGSEYRNNYQLDVEKLGVTEVAEKALNALANIVFSVISCLGFLTVAIFYHALSFDLAALLQPQIDSIQLALHDSVFTPLLQVALMGAIVLAITKICQEGFFGPFGAVRKSNIYHGVIIDDSTRFGHITKLCDISDKERIGFDINRHKWH